MVDAVSQTPPVPGRSCAGCTLCCKLLRVPALSKPRLVWCQHCEINTGCSIYEKRPAECAVYFCDYRTQPHLGEEWRPVDCGMIMSYEPEARRVDVQVDPERRDAWRKEPFFSQIRIIAENALQGQGYLILWQGNEAIAILPDREIHLGPVHEGAMITVTRTTTRLGVSYDVSLAATGDSQPIGGAQPD